LKAPAGLQLSSKRGISIAGSPLWAYDIPLYSYDSEKNGKLNYERYIALQIALKLGANTRSMLALFGPFAYKSR